MRRCSFLWLILGVVITAPAALFACARKRHSAVPQPDGAQPAGGTGTNPGPGMMGSATGPDMRTYMEMFEHHAQIRRTVHEVPGGIRTLTESDDARIASLLQAHVAAMYEHLNKGEEVVCMSDNLPIMFRDANRYRRTLQITPRGVAVVETSSDPGLARAIREHAGEVTAFVREGMPAMMRMMMR